MKLLVVAPYPALAHVAKQAVQSRTEIEVDVVVGNLVEGVALAREAEASGYDVILSRGGTLQLIEEQVTVPIVEIPITGYDLLRVVTLTKQFPGKSAIVGFSNITTGAKTLVDILQLQVDIFPVETSDEVPATLQRLKKEGYSVVLGDTITHELASSYGLQSILIQSGIEAVLEAIHKAETLYRYLQHQTRKFNLPKEVLQQRGENIAVLDGQGNRVFQHWSDYEYEHEFEKLVHFYSQRPDNHFTDVVSVRERSYKVEMNMLTHFSKSQNRQIRFVRLFHSSNRQPIMYHNSRLKPYVVAESTTMKNTLDALRKCLFDSKAIYLQGEPGTGKRLLGQWIHYERHLNKKLCATISATSLPQLQEKLDEVATIIVTDWEDIETTEAKKVADNCLQWASVDPGRMAVLTSASVISGVQVKEEIHTIHVPPLREREEDISLLVSHFVTELHEKQGVPLVNFQTSAIDALESYFWRENVTELKFIVKECVRHSTGFQIDKSDVNRVLQSLSFPQSRGALSLEGTLEDIERRAIELVMEEEGYNQTKVAKRLGINRSTLWRKLNK
ncbi:sigma-54-dependent Fis family transcriptional regulator [Bacillus fonticola]|uniref:sigma-54-dependent Fis family transcriptional regulator n=1 Tax=Bacillus fonticola TaxID=2728853 RepID=UPI0014767280|nr:PrpR N-terminal domain-containing protein [Bacillus fonticola]